MGHLPFLLQRLTTPWRVYRINHRKIRTGYVLLEFKMKKTPDIFIESVKLRENDLRNN